jgi:nicotinate-nucleotide pyrophosphorylase (carboxylating)
MLPHPAILTPLVDSWIKEDIGRGDRTTMAIFPHGAPRGKAVWTVKKAGVVCGLPIGKLVFQRIDPHVNFQALVPEGAECSENQEIAIIESDLASLLLAERVALNLAMRLSGISTLTREYVRKIQAVSAKVKLLDTRKLTPSMRLLEKYATFIGGASNHRYGLDDAAMIKDNHISACGGIAPAVAKLRANLPFLTPIEVEVENLEQVAEVAPLQVDAIMLDNMSVQDMAQAISLIRALSPRTKIEASGGITLDNIAEIAALDLDFISTSAMITRSSWLDMSMEIA